MKGFLKSSKKRDVFKKTVCYGLISATEKYDIMSASIALANYFASAKGYRTALVIAEEDSAVLHMLSEKKCVDVEPVGYADEYLTYYCVSGAGELKRLKDRSFERLVVVTEASHLDDDLLREIDALRIFADLSPWRYQDLRKYYRNTLCSLGFHNTGEQRLGRNLYTMSIRQNDMERFKKEFGANVIETGYFKDPYRLGKADLMQVERIL